MSGLNAMRGLRAAVAAVLLATACGGGDSSGLATLEGTSTPAPAVDPEEIEPVSEPTAVTEPVSQTTAPSAVVSEVAADPGEPEADETSGAVAIAEPEGRTVEESIETQEVTDQEPVVTEDLTDEERLLAFAECMRENGVDFPDPVVEADGTVTFGFRPGGGGGLGRPREIGQDSDLPAARDACSGMLEGLAFGPGQGGFDLIELQDTLLEFAQCMRDNGVDMGDPDLSRFGPGANDDDQAGGPFGPSVAIDIDDPDFAAAFAVCQQQLPQAGRGSRLPGGG